MGLETRPTVNPAITLLSGALKSASGMHPMTPPSAAVVESIEWALAKTAKLVPLRIWLRRDRAVALVPVSITDTQASIIFVLWRAT